ncbi:MAG: serine hydrolase [Bacteroidales bacterium]|jgi:CubicO group peptidase (beta-lactamase class C family)|nr:serine hydrolase [Bacteroidales bacterium]MDY0369205.1 serine hydrolase [Bacteroidales bacterium]
MKTIFLTIALAISSMAMYAQIGNPRSFFEQQDESQLHNEVQKPPNIIFESKSSNTSLKQTSSFDPIWAQQFQNALDSIMQLTGGMGASIAVYTPEEGLWTGVSGISHDDVPITTDMRFGVADHTELFLAVTLLKLQEQGILSLEDPLYQWLPPIQYVDSTITIRQLLTHQTGVFDYWTETPVLINHIWDDTSRFWTIEEIIGSLEQAHFMHGTGYRFSNTNPVLAGMVIEAATGQSWPQTIRNLILEPYNLESIFAGAFEPRTGPVAAEWDYFTGNLIINSPMTAEYSQGNACAALLSTAADMVQWYHALFTGSILSETSMQLLCSVEPSSLVGMSIFMGRKEYPFYYHTSYMFGYTSIALYDPWRNAVICVLFNNHMLKLWRKIEPLIHIFFYEYPKKLNDAGIIAIQTPWEHYCTDTITPIVTLKNFGTAPLTSATIKYGIEGNTANSFDWNGSLLSGDSNELTLPPLIIDGGAHTFYCFTELPNGQPEGYTFNDTTYSNFFVNIPGSALSGLFEDFSDTSFPKEGWTTNSLSIQNWNRTSLTGLKGTGAAVKENYDPWEPMGASWEPIGTYSDMQLPLLNTTNIINPELSFDYAYTIAPGSLGDSLQVSVSQDCGATWETLFYKGGTELTTTVSNSYTFYPKSEQEWAHITFSLAEYTGDILIRFRARYGNSNNLYLDNIFVGSSVGLAESSSKLLSDIQIYPNPTTDKIQISVGQTTFSEIQVIQVELFDLYGKLMERYTIKMADFRNNRTEMDLSKLSSGTYLIHIRTSDQLVVKKLIKM